MLRARGRRWGRGKPLLTAAVRVAVLAGAISATKVILFAIGSGSFLAAHPASDLAWVYLILAVLAAGGALALLPHLERARPVVALGRLLGASMLIVPSAALLLVFDAPGAALGVLVLAHLYNIASEILLWLVAAAWIPAPELRRSTLWICLATALGGLVGGIGAERLLPLGAPAALGAGALAATAYAALWLRACRQALGNGGDVEMQAGAVVPPRWRVVLAHPLAVPLGAASFMLTFVWVVTEYICLASYQLLDPDPTNLSRLLAIVYAALQLCEFLAIALLAGPATRWVSPVWRSLLFPTGALATLAWLGRQPRELSAILVAHAYTEAISNGLFDPVHASNFAAAPLRLQASLRTLADGICYPLGMAAGGAALLLVSPQNLSNAALEPMLATAQVAATLFAGVGVLTGIMIRPSLMNALGLTTEAGSSARRALLRAARLALGPWIRRARLRDLLLAARHEAKSGGAIRRQVDLADRRALRQAFRQARLCDQGGAIRQLEVLLDSRSAETRALTIEALLSLPVRSLFQPFGPALRRRY